MAVLDRERALEAGNKCCRSKATPGVRNGRKCVFMNKKMGAGARKLVLVTEYDNYCR